MLLYIILTFSLYITGSGVNKRHVSNSAEPVDLDPPNYNINSWVKQLHLQHCVLVEIGDQFCAVSCVIRNLFVFKLKPNLVICGI